MYKREYDTDLVAEARAKLRAAFVNLRKLGLKARANFMCCQGCGNSNLSLALKAEDVGAVFWHQQDETGFRERGYLYLAYFTCSSDEVIGEEGFSGELLGHMIVSVLTEHGLEVKWDGSSNTRICVYAEGARKREEES